MNIFFLFQEELCVECGAGERRGGDPGVRPGRYILPRPPPPPSTAAKHCTIESHLCSPVLVQGSKEMDLKS